MRAARLHAYGQKLQVDEVPRPQIRSNAVIIRVLGSQLPAFTSEVVSGKRQYAMPQPFPIIPGPNSLGIVEEIGENVFDIEKGQLVLVDPRVFGSLHVGARRDDILLGWTALTPDSIHTQQVWKDGAWAQYQLVPASSLTIIPHGIQSMYSTAQWSALSYLAISYGALQRGDFQTGQIVIITGATGDLGSGAVLLALAMGASLILAVGRDKQKLDKLKELDEKRVIPIVHSSSATDFNVECLKKFMNGNDADLVLDFVGGTSDVEPLLTCIRALKFRGKAIFVGNIENSIPIKYVEIMINEIEIRGCFMFPANSYQQLIRLVQANLLDLNHIATRIFPLEQINEAIEAAAKRNSNNVIDWVIVQPNKS